MIPSVAHLVSELAADLADAHSTTEGPATTWSRGERVFGVLGPDGIELRLEPAIAAAAARTPDAAPSPRGTDWVRFSPRELDGHATDRLTAWFDFAYRHAAG
ncbi:MAG: hypothetical protein QOI92_975 [Chloroflexota bacterium]|nr:hypothetical protein [Chloroflexota bacterium]